MRPNRGEEPVHHEPVSAPISPPGGHPGAAPRPKKRPPNIRSNRRGGLSSALVVVGVLAIFAFILSYELHNAIGTPTDNAMLLIGVALVFGGAIGWVLYQKLLNDVF